MMLRHLFVLLLLVTWSSPLCGQSDKIVSPWPKTFDQLDRQVTRNSGSLANLVAQLSKQTVPIVINTRALEEMGLPTSQQVFFDHSQSTLRGTMDQLSLDLDLTYRLHDTFIELTTIDWAEDELTERLYQVRSLLSVAATDKASEWDHQGLLDLIQAVITPETWEVLGGQSTSRWIRDSLVITTTDPIAIKVRQLIRALQKAKSLDADAARHHAPIPIASLDLARMNEIHRKIGETVALEQLGIDPEMQLDEWANQVSKAINIPLVVQNRSLEDFGLDRTEIIRSLPTTAPLHEFLAFALDPIDLCANVQGESIWIMANQCPGLDLGCTVYPVADLVAADRKIGNTEVWLSEFFIGQPVNRHFRLIDGIERPQGSVAANDLIGTIVRTIDPESWEELGGSGVIRYFYVSRSLVVTSSDATQRKITDLLTRVRNAQQPVAGGLIDDSLTQFVTVAFDLNPQDSRSAQAAELVQRGVEPLSWDHQEASATWAGNTLLVRNKVVTVANVCFLLKQLGLVRVATPARFAPPKPPQRPQLRQPGGFF